MNLKKEHRPYIWSLITLILSVAIIFASSLASGFLLNISALSDDFSDEFSLELPDISEIMSSSIVQTNKPVYFPLGSNKIDSQLYNLEKLSNSDPLFDSVVSAFLDKISTAIYILFDFNSYVASSFQMSQKCTLWGVYSKETDSRIDTMVSFNIILMDNNNTLWSVTAYGNDKAITHLERSLYYSSVSADKNTHSSESIKKNLQGAIENIIANIIILGDTFGLLEIEKNDNIRNYTSYINDFDLRLEENNETTTTYSISYAKLNIMFNIVISSYSNDLLAITRVK